MASNPSYRGKHEWVRHTFHWSGASFLASKLPARDSLPVLNYHRIGNPDEDLFDPGVFSATAEEFDAQIAYLKKNVSLVIIEEALAYIDGTEKEKARRCRVLITFDDGYLDNYEIAQPILRSHGVQGVFFLVTSMVGTHHVPWRDHISYLVKTGKRRRFTLCYPGQLEFDIEHHNLDRLRSETAVWWLTGHIRWPCLHGSNDGSSSGSKILTRAVKVCGRELLTE
jgi:Polysaccharide deacetylase